MSRDCGLLFCELEPMCDAVVQDSVNKVCIQIRELESLDPEALDKAAVTCWETGRWFLG